MRCWTESKLALLRSHAWTAPRTERSAGVRSSEAPPDLRSGSGPGRRRGPTSGCGAGSRCTSRAGRALPRRPRHSVRRRPPRAAIVRTLRLACHCSGLMPVADARYEPAGFRHDGKLTRRTLRVYGSVTRTARRASIAEHLPSSDQKTARVAATPADTPFAAPLREMQQSSSRTAELALGATGWADWALGNAVASGPRAVRTAGRPAGQR
jgi:hypothetical protein